MSRVLVIGGSGRTGLLIADKAHRAGHDVTVTARNRRHLLDSGRVSGGITVVEADVHAPDTIRSAAAGQDVIVITVSSPARASGGVYSAAADAVISAVPAGTRVVVISSGGVRPDDRNLAFFYRRIMIPLYMQDLYRDMRLMEERIRASSLRWTFVRPGYLRDGAAKTVRILDGRNPRHGWRLSRTSLAAFVTDQLTSNEWVFRAPTLAQ
jgi:putative NADH-flavin reductase